MKTIRQYLFDDALETSATVISVSDGAPHFVELSSTIFHPQGGGQPADRGTIDDLTVHGVRFDDRERIQHQFDSAPNVKVGQVVKLHVDAPWRLRYSRLHTSGHLIAHIIEAAFPELYSQGGHHWPGQCRVEFGGTTTADLNDVRYALEAHLANAIACGHRVETLGRSANRRRIHIENIGSLPCAGTHVSSLSDLGGVVIRSLKSRGGLLRVGYDVPEPVAPNISLSGMAIFDRERILVEPRAARRCD